MEEGRRLSDLVYLNCLSKGGHPDNAGRRGDLTFVQKKKSTYTDKHLVAPWYWEYRVRL
jgi:hypothetical protein